MIKLFNALVKISGYPVQWVCFRTKVYYENKSTQSRKIRGSAVIVSNHTSVYDYAVFMFVFLFRTLRYQMAECLFKNRLLKWFLKRMGGIFVDRYSFDFLFVKKSVDVLNKKGVLGIFPEGRIPKENEEKPLPFKTSATYIALESGAKIIPVYTNGSYFKKSRARVIIGCPIDVRALWDDSLDEKTNIDSITNTIREKIVELKYELDKKTKK